MKAITTVSGKRLFFGVLAAVLCAGYSVRGEVTSGFQNTVNNYAVGMNPENECRHPASGKKPACSQHFNFHFQAKTDGTINAPFEITNDSLRGFCGRVHIVVRDRAGNPPGAVLLDIRSGLYCIPGKGADTHYHERVQHVDWTFNASPNVGLNGHDLYMVGEDYQDHGLKLADIVGGALGPVVKVIGTAVQIGGAILSVLG
jgi:hypothetical protein